MITKTDKTIGNPANVSPLCFKIPPQPLYIRVATPPSPIPAGLLKDWEYAGVKMARAP